MKPFVYLFLTLICPAWAFAGWTGNLPAHEQVFMPTYDPKTEDTLLGKTPIIMDFGSSRILNEDALATLAPGAVVRIDLVYSRFPVSFLPQQESLNRSRMRALLQRVPQLASHASIQWRWVEQTACGSEAEARELFHGFMVFHRTAAGSVTQDQSQAFQERIHKAMDERRWSAFVDSNAMWMMTPEQFDIYVREHHLIVDVMQRHPEWSRKLIVQDVTGSMMPYYEQVVIWHALSGREANMEGYLFFNDGDMRPDDQKKPGKVGGLYFTRDLDIDHVMVILMAAAMAGSGGDQPENNVEALIEGIRRCPEAQEVILVADNWATPRDLSLLDQVDRPVHVILCGAYMGVNVEYLNLALRTGGSIHTVESDLENLVNLNEGEVVTVLGNRFAIKQGQFVPLL